MARSTDLLARIEGDLAEDGAISDEIRFVTRDADQAAAVHAPGFAVA